MILAVLVLVFQTPEQDRVRELEERVARLESQDDAGIPKWIRRLTLSGLGNLGYYAGRGESYYPEGTFNVQDVRLFLDADLGRQPAIGDTVVAKSVGLTFEWDVVRLGRLANPGGTGTRVGEFHVELQHLAESRWASVQIGRFQLPVSENYLRFSKGQKDNPFVSHTLGGPWYWDEGIRLYGSDPSGAFGYVASVTDGETAFNFDSDESKQFTLKLFADPAPGIHVSASILKSGKIGSPSSPAAAGLWLGESFPRQFGGGTAVANFDDGVAVADGPPELEDIRLWGVDVVLKSGDDIRAWLAYGRAEIQQDGPSLYDRTLIYWIAEVVLEGRLLSPALGSTYLGLRANGYGTGDSGKGYLLDLRYSSTLGFNIEDLTAISVVVGWRLTAHATLRIEYTAQTIDLVRGVTPAIEAEAEDADHVQVEIGVHF